jgi:hypothetical protein
LRSRFDILHLLRELERLTANDSIRAVGAGDGDFISFRMNGGPPGQVEADRKFCRIQLRNRVFAVRGKDKRSQLELDLRYRFGPPEARTATFDLWRNNVQDMIDVMASPRLQP